MNLPRIALSALGAFVAYFIIGGLLFGVIPSLRTEFQKYPAVFRSQDGQMKFMPVGMVAMFVAMLALAAIYAMQYRGGLSVGGGARLGALFGALVGVFAIGSFVIHNYVNLNIGLKLTIEQSVAYFAEWVVAGVVIGMLYRPGMPH